MKKLSVLFAFILTISFASAQTTGPKAKNTPTYKKKGSIQVYTKPRAEIKGPKAKNNFMEARENGSEIPSSGKEKLMGPKAKNQKHFK